MSVTREIPTKAKPQYHISSIRLAETQKFDNILCWPDCGKTGPLVHCVLGIQTAASPIWRGIWPFLAKLHMYLPFDSAIPLLGIYLQNILAKNKTRRMHKAMHGSTICYSKKTRKYSNVHRLGLADHTGMTLHLKKGKRRLSRYCDIISRIQY